MISRSQTLAYNGGSCRPPIWQQCSKNIISEKKNHFLYFKCTSNALQMHFTFCNNDNNNALLLEKPLNRN